MSVIQLYIQFIINNRRETVDLEYTHLHKPLTALFYNFATRLLEKIFSDRIHVS